MRIDDLPIQNGDFPELFLNRFFCNCSTVASRCPHFRDSGLERFARRFDFLGGAVKAKTAESQLGWFKLPF